MRIATLALGLASLPALGQTAHVIALTGQEAYQAKQLHDEQEQLTKKETDFRLSIEQRYISDRLPTSAFACITSAGGHSYACPDPPKADSKDKNVSWSLKEGWRNGYEYSDDYKYIVPKEAPRPTGCSINSTPYFNMGGGTLTPYYGVTN